MGGGLVSADFASDPDSKGMCPSVRRIEGVTSRGKPCELIDNTGEGLPKAELQDILLRLIEQDAFGFKPLSASGANTLDLEHGETAHIQIGERLYRLIVHRYQACLEKF